MPHWYGYPSIHRENDASRSVGIHTKIERIIQYHGFWFPELKFLTAIDNHYIQWCRCHVVIITCRKLHCQEWPWPSKSSSFQMLIFPCTLYIVHVSNNPLLLTMTLFVHTITNNCFHGEKTKKKSSFFCSCDYSQTLTHTHTQISLFCKRVKLLVMMSNLSLFFN